MSLTSEGMSPADFAAVTGNHNSGFGDGNGAWWIIILFLFVFCGWGGNGWGNGASQGAADNYVLASDFATLQRQIDQATSNLEHRSDVINGGLCDGFYAQNTTMLTGFGGVNQNMATGFANAELSRANQQAALMAQLNSMAMQSQQCCCDTREAINQGFCTTNYNNATNTRDIIDAQNASTRAILDKLTSQELAAKDAQIAAQNQQIFGLQLKASQADQTNQLQSYVNGQFVYYNPRPVPAFSVGAPYQFSGCSSCGCTA